MTIAGVHVARALRAEAVRTGGVSALWTVLIPVAVVVPAAITFGIGYLAERFARIPGQVAIQQVPTSNAAYWVISITVAIVAVWAAYGQAAEFRYGATEYARLALPRPWTAMAGKWLFYGALGAVAAAAMTIAVLTGLPVVSPLVYGAVSLTDPVGQRLVVTVALFAFFAAGLGVGAGALIRTPAGAVGAILFWVYVLEEAVGYLPNGTAAQRFMPFLNGVYGTGQDIALAPPWGPDAALAYACAVFAAVFAVGVLHQMRRNSAAHDRKDRP